MQLRELDLLHFAPGAFIFVVGLFMPLEGELSTSIYSIIVGVGAVLALYSVWYAFRILMNFADDCPLVEGLGYSAWLLLRAGAAFWLWLALALWALTWRYPDGNEILSRAAILTAAFGALVFVAGMAWYLIYAVAKRAAHAPNRN